MTTTSAQSSTILGPIVALSAAAAPAVVTQIAVRLDRGNFALWRALSLTNLSGASLHGFLDGTAAAPAQTITDGTGDAARSVPNPAYATWWTHDQKPLAKRDPALASTRRVRDAQNAPERAWTCPGHDRVPPSPVASDFPSPSRLSHVLSTTSATSQTRPLPLPCPVTVAIINTVHHSTAGHDDRPRAPIHLLMRHDASKDRQTTLHRPLPSPTPLRHCSIVIDDDLPVPRCLSMKL
ncbi:hypothetical protein QYE76_062932 [Lolium multiflorum]|uniref:Retrotransposon Copia-like N-terminal domain-containing protein n=1 Tax=Lolium multiflorum TaxID=4521 RepID=A0AAD8S416_LOLMU|nr:hypothetical protein QYE76_062932 [Lolium multiflorum]